MRPSWNGIRVRAARFAEEWKHAHYEKGESQTFYNEFFEIFGVTRRRVASFEEPVKRLGDARGFIDLFWKGVLLVEQKSAGRDLVRAKQQALDYFPGLKEQELPRYLNDTSHFWSNRLTHWSLLIAHCCLPPDACLYHQRLSFGLLTAAHGSIPHEKLATRSPTDIISHRNVGPRSCGSTRALLARKRCHYCQFY